jgi:hypothetical protein
MPERQRCPTQVEVVQRGADAGSRGDIDGPLAPFSSDAPWELSAVGMAPSGGHEEMRAFFEDWTGADGDFAIAPESEEWV